jgi:phosphoribosylglycinamide formyltransferase-1
MLKVAVLISGGGTSLRNLLEVRSAGNLPVELVSVISSRRHAGGLEIARQAGLETSVVARSRQADPLAYSQAIFDPLTERGVELVVMAGFLQHALIPEAYVGRVINIHPSLIPSFCGHGFYGLRVHQAAIDYGVKISGCTVHFVDNDYDHGPVILQRACPVRDDDTPESLQRRVFELECQALPEAIRGIALGHVQWQPGERLVRWHLPASMDATASDR